MELLVILIFMYAVKSAVDDTRAALRKSRDAYSTSADTRFPKSARSRRVVHAARHDAGFWAGQAAQVFPAARHGLAAGWHAGRQAQAVGRAEREKAKAEHLETRVRLMPEIYAHLARQRAALEQLRAEREAGEGSREGNPQPVMAPPSWAPGVVGRPGPARENGESATRPAASGVPVVPTTVPDSPVAAAAPRVCTACGNPEYGPRHGGGNWGPLVLDTEPLYPGDTGMPRLVHRAHFEDESTGFYGQPYEDAPAQDGTPGQAQEETEGSGEGAAAPETEPPASPTQGEPFMSGAADVTYDGVLASMAADRENAENRAADQSKAMRVSQDTGESMQALNMDAAVLSAMADHLDANQAALAALQRCQESAEQVTAVLKSNHQLLAQAHQDAPVRAADREFYDA